MTLRTMLSRIAEDWNANGRDWTKPGFRALAVYRFGVWRMTVHPKFLRAPLSLIYRFLFRRIRNRYGIEFPYSVKAGQRIVIEHQGAIVIHGNATIGDDCTLRQGVTIGNRHRLKPFDAPSVGNRVNIGAGAQILGKVVVADDSTIGANAVVLNDVEAGSTVVGIPARPINKARSASPLAPVDGSTTFAADKAASPSAVAG